MATVDSEMENDYDFVDDVQEVYKCPVCFVTPMVNPTHVPGCGHVFCKTCIEDWIRVSPQPPRCPVDNNQLDRTKLHADLRIQREISSLKVRCKYQAMGCEKVMEISNIKDHMKKCEFLTILCPNGCMASVPKRWLETHKTDECIKRRAKCEMCEKWMEMGQLVAHTCPLAVSCEYCNKGPMKREVLTQEHSKVCEETPVNCVFAPFGCTEKLVRKNASKHEKTAAVAHLNLLTKAAHELYNKIGFSPTDIVGNSAEIQCDNVDGAASARNGAASAQNNAALSIRERLVELEATNTEKFESIFVHFSQLSDSRTEFAERIGFLENENKELKLQLRDVKEENSNLQNNKDLKQQLRKVEEENNNLQNDVELKQKMREIEEENSNLQNNMINMKTSLADMSAEMFDLRNKSSCMQQALDTVVCHQNGLDKTRKAFRIKVDTKNVENDVESEIDQWWKTLQAVGTDSVSGEMIENQLEESEKESLCDAQVKNCPVDVSAAEIHTGNKGKIPEAIPLKKSEYSAWKSNAHSKLGNLKEYYCTTCGRVGHSEKVCALGRQENVNASHKQRHVGGRSAQSDDVQNFAVKPTSPIKTEDVPVYPAAPYGAKSEIACSKNGEPSQSTDQSPALTTLHDATRNQISEVSGVCMPTASNSTVELDVDSQPAVDDNTTDEVEIQLTSKTAPPATTLRYGGNRGSGRGGGNQRWLTGARNQQGDSWGSQGVWGKQSCWGNQSSSDSQGGWGNKSKRSG